jgi:hypothetical protein
MVSLGAVQVAFSGFLFHREQVRVQVMSFEAQSEDAGQGAVASLQSATRRVVPLTTVKRGKRAFEIVL